MNLVGLGHVAKHYSTVVPGNASKEIPIPPIHIDELSVHVVAFVHTLEGCTDTPCAVSLVNNEFIDGTMYLYLYLKQNSQDLIVCARCLDM